MTGDGPSRNCRDVHGGSSIAPELLRSVADAAETSPYDLPPLNDIVDPDALNALFQPAPTGSATALVALEVDGSIATVRNDGSTAVVGRTNDADLAAALGAVDGEAVATATHDWSTPGSLLSTVVGTVADATGADSVAVRNAIAALVDRSALDSLFRPRGNGVPRGDAGLRLPFREHDVVVLSDGSVAVQPTLTRIKRTGGNLLVVGSVPREVSEATSRALLGSGDDRARLVAVHGQGVETAVDRLSGIDADLSRTLVVDHGDGRRSTAAMETGTPAQRPTIRSVDGGLDSLAAGIVDAVDDLEDACDGFSPGQLRLCLDSLGSIQSRYDREDVADFLGTVTGRIERGSGIGHFVLLADRSSEHVRAIEGRFDVVVELRVGVGGPQQRWHLRETGHSTAWFPVGDDGDEEDVA